SSGARTSESAAIPDPNLARAWSVVSRCSPVAAGRMPARRRADFQSAAIPEPSLARAWPVVSRCSSVLRAGCPRADFQSATIPEPNLARAWSVVSRCSSVLRAECPRAGALAHWRRIDRWQHLNTAPHGDENARAPRLGLTDQLTSAIDRCGADKRVHYQLRVLGQVTVGREGHINNVMWLQGHIGSQSANHILIIDNGNLWMRQ